MRFEGGKEILFSISALLKILREKRSRLVEDATDSQRTNPTTHNIGIQILQLFLYFKSLCQKGLISLFSRLIQK